MRLPCTLLIAALLPSLWAGHIENVTTLTARPERHGRVDFDVLLRGAWTNPYRSSEVALDLRLVAPSGRTVVVPGFPVSGAAGELSVWQVRFAPAEAGTYRGEVVLADVSGRATAPVSFTVAESDRRGFLHAGDNWCLRFDDGTPFRGLGENIGWESRSFDDSKYFRALHESPRYHYEYLLGTLAAHGGNFFRTWMCPWNLPLEWHQVRDTARASADPAPFNTSAIRRMDELVALSDNLGLHFMLTLDSGGNFLGGDWDGNNYNRTNGGPATTAAEFFTDPTARAQYRDRLRFLVARWGWSPSIAAWEFFNEIDNLTYGHQPRIPDAVATAWHDEMSRYLKQLDPYGRLVTTSISHRPLAGLDDLPALDLNQRHIYGHTESIPAAVREAAAGHGKPYVIGEFAYEWDWSKNFDDFAPAMDRDFRRGVWLGLFSPTPILPMSWWWEYFDARGRTADLRPVRTILDAMLAAGGGSFADSACTGDNPAVPALSVRCGDTIYVYLRTDAATAQTTALAFPAGLATPGAIRAFDPATARWTELPATLPLRATVAAGGDLVLVLAPAR